VARVCRFLFLSFLIGHTPSLLAQKAPAPSAKTQQPQKNSDDQLPDETNLPEEDESLAPKKYVLNPLESKRNIEIGNQYFNKGAYPGARSRYLDATRYNPSSPEAFLKLGMAEEKLHHDPLAKAAFQKVLKLGPDSKFASEAKKKLSSIKD
jgi:tetratricopeptide (TPR) repeat protein